MLGGRNSVQAGDSLPVQESWKSWVFELDHFYQIWQILEGFLHQSPYYKSHLNFVQKRDYVITHSVRSLSVRL